MPTEHIIYIPTIFLLGMLAGRFIPTSRPFFAAAPGRGKLGWFAAGSIVLTLLIFALTHVVAPLGGVHAVSNLGHGQTVLDQQPVFSASEIYTRLEGFGAAGRDAYKAMTYSSDLLFPTSLLAALVLLGTYLGRRAGFSGAAWRWRTLLPVAWFVADMAENAMIYQILDAYPEHMAWAPALGVVTVLKFALLLSSIVMLVALAWFGRTTKSEV
jgi:hypothetical protein